MIRHSPSFVAGILVGGQSLRMGRPKATLPLADGRTLIEHVVDAVRRARAGVGEIVLLGQGVSLPASLADLRVLADVEFRAGPLGGLCSLLAHAGDRWGLLLACDLPLVRPVLLERLFAAVDPAHDAVAFRRPDRPDSWHACCALYHPRLLPAALQELHEGRRRLQRLLAEARLCGLDPAPEEQRMLLNLNTRQDYDHLLRSA